MSIMNPLPPQAYTKETLVQAYAWLQSQNENIKEIATTPDVLVSLYLKAKLQGDGALERPSIQNFKNELKNLAGMMGEFEVLESASTHGSSASSTIRFRSQDFRERVERSISSEKPPLSDRASMDRATPMERPRAQSYSDHLEAAAAAAAASMNAQAHHQTHTQAHAQTYTHSQERAQVSPPPQSPPPKSESAAAQDPSGLETHLDARSVDMIQEVKVQFNLSCDTEALRLLIAIGYNHVKTLLK